MKRLFGVSSVAKRLKSKPKEKEKSKKKVETSSSEDDGDFYGGQQVVTETEPKCDDDDDNNSDTTIEEVVPSIPPLIPKVLCDLLIYEVCVSKYFHKYRKNSCCSLKYYTE